MTRIFKHTVSLILCLVLFVTTFSVGFTASADAESDTRAEINRLQQQAKDLENDIKNLKSQKADQKAILTAIEKKVANTQAQVRACNNQISSINAKISANKAEIEKNNAEIEDTKLEFKKRLRAIYMSSSDSSVKILLGAENFADYLQLAQMTATVSRHDKAIIEKIVDAIKVLEEKNKENEKLIEQQVSVRAVVEEALKSLEAEEAEAERIYNKIAKNQSSVEADKATLQQQIKDKQDYLNSLTQGSPNSGGTVVNPALGFIWPVPGVYNVYSPWGNRSGGMHYGIDISAGGIYGKPIVAITDGKVYQMHTSCPHRDRNSRCRCGRGWGNHIGLDHFRINGLDYRAMYAHMDTVASGMYVGKYVKQGQVIGYVGTTGDSTGYHLHFGLMQKRPSEINYGWINPKGYVY